MCALRQAISETLESRVLLSTELPGGLTVERINALPNDSPIPFDIHIDEHEVAPLIDPPPAPYTTIRNSGPVGNRVDIVLVGDGYQSAQLTTYAAHAASFNSGFFNEAPFNRYANYFNVHRVDVTSTDSGVDNDPTQGILKNTALDMAFWTSGIERLLGVNVSKAKSYAINAPQMDQVIAIANSTKYGGAGYSSQDVGTYSGGNSSSLEVAKHEFGHAFGDLADEYDYADGATYTGGEPATKNITIYDATTLAAENRKWFRWLDLFNVDTFEGAQYSQFGIYRPTFNSKMRALNRPFEEVNAEQLILKLYQTVRPIDSATAAGSYEINASSFAVDPVDPVGAPLAVQWYLDDVAVPGATGATFDPVARGLSGNHTLKVVVTDTTASVRDEAARASLMTEQRVWTLIDTLPPVASELPFGFEIAPMSVSIAFNEAVGASIQATDLVLLNQTTAELIDAPSITSSYDASNNTARFAFPGFAQGILPDGNYLATVSGLDVQDSAGLSMSGDFTQEFYVLAGDADRNRTVDTIDFNILVASFSQSPKTFSQADFNHDTTVDTLDFSILASRFGTVLAPQGSLLISVAVHLDEPVLSHHGQTGQQLAWERAFNSAPLYSSQSNTELLDSSAHALL